MFVFSFVSRRFTTNRIHICDQMQRGWARSAACLRVHGPDQQGIVRACSQILDKFGCAIMKSEQYTDPRLCHFYQRSLFHPSNHSHIDDRVMFQSELKSEIIDELRSFQKEFGLDMVKVNFRDKPKKMAIFVSKYDHCLVSTGSQFVSMFFPRDFKTD